MRAHLLGEGAVLVDLEIDDDPHRASRTLAAIAAIRNHLPGADVVAGPGSALIAGLGAWDAIDPIVDEAARAALSARAEASTEGPLLVVRAVYDGPDLDEAAVAAGLSRDEVVALHSGTTYRAELLGFLPGFAYLGPVPAPLRLPRRPSPRPRVPALSIGVAAGFTGVYPFASPGGWHLLGRAAGFLPFDPSREPPSAITPGARVRFEPVAPEDAVPPASPASPPARLALAGRRLEVLSAPAAATVQDGGRPGRLSQGLPPSGPLDPAAFAAANLAVGNAPGSAAVEIPLGSLEVRAEGGRLRCSIDGEPPITLSPGESLLVPPCPRAVRYLAVAGGIDVPPVLGSRSTLLAIALGGHEGRPLRRRDVLPVGSEPPAARPSALPPPPDPPEVATLHVDPGPHAGRFPEGALEALLSGSFVVSRHGDRVGVRLEGARVPCEGAALSLPCPMVRGAVEITPDGTPIVLGPDHPITGGYPVLASLRRGSQALLARLAPGRPARFALALPRPRARSAGRAVS